MAEVSAPRQDWQYSSPLGACTSVSDYQKLHRIGEGTYGFVYKAVNRATGRTVALKRIILHNEQQDGFPLTSVRELRILQACRHENIVSLLKATNKTQACPHSTSSPSLKPPPSNTHTTPLPNKYIHPVFTHMSTLSSILRKNNATRRTSAPPNAPMIHRSTYQDTFSCAKTQNREFLC